MYLYKGIPVVQLSHDESSENKAHPLQPVFWATHAINHRPYADVMERVTQLTA